MKQYCICQFMISAVMALALAACQKDSEIAPINPDTHDSVPTVDTLPANPTETLSGLFSVSGGHQVRFATGNLQYVDGAWRNAEHQYDYWGSFSDNAWDHFGWSTNNTDFGMRTSDIDNNYSGEYIDWGSVFGSDSPWRTLSSEEWIYLRFTRPNAYSLCATGTIRLADGSLVAGCFFLPDDWTQPEGCSFNAALGMLHDDFSANAYNVADGSWAAMQAAGAVFLPAAGYRHGYSYNFVGTQGRYWTAPSDGRLNYYLYFTGRSIDCTNTFGASYGNCVRLVIDND